MVPRFFAAVDKAVGEIRENFPLTNVEDINPLRPEAIFVTNETNPVEILYGPQEEQVERSSSEKTRRLWALRRRRESDPEFRRLTKTTSTPPAR